jgi:hypothetical protein
MVNKPRQPTFDDPGVDDPRALSERQQWLGWLTNLIDGALLGWGDEATAGILSTVDPSSPGYQSELNQFRRHQDRYNEQNPIKGFATGLGGSLLSGGALPKAAMADGFWNMAMRGAGTNLAAAAAGGAGGYREGDRDIKPNISALEPVPAIISGFSPRFGGSVIAHGSNKKQGYQSSRPNMVSSSIHGRHQATPKGKAWSSKKPKRTSYTDEELELMYNPQAYPLKRYGEKKKGK